MKYLLVAPAAIAMMLAFTMQLVTVAEETQAKTIRYADDMNSALDCAFKGVDLNICSPGLYDYDYKGDINKTIGILENPEMREIRYVKEDKDGNLIVVYKK